jgi:hypothetical protein
MRFLMAKEGNMGQAKTFGYSYKLRTAEEDERAKRLVRKNKDRFEIDNRGADGTFFYYLPRGRHGSQIQYDNGMKISTWIETGQGVEPD